MSEQRPVTIPAPGFSPGGWRGADARTPLQAWARAPRAPREPVAIWGQQSGGGHARRGLGTLDLGRSHHGSGASLAHCHLPGTRVRVSPQVLVCSPLRLTPA